MQKQESEGQEDKEREKDFVRHGASAVSSLDERTSFMAAKAHSLVSSSTSLINEATALLKYRADSNKETESLLEELGTKAREAGAFAELLQTKQRSLQAALEKWETLLATLPDISMNDRTIYNDMVEDENGLSRTIEKIAQIVGKLHLLEADLRSMHGDLTPMRIASPANKKEDDRLGHPSIHQSEHTLRNQNPHVLSYANMGVKLPKFGGGASEWAEFWPLYEEIVDTSSMPTIAKVSTLVSCLTGPARKAVEGYALISSNYENIKDVLMEEFGNPEEIRRKLRNALKALQTSSRWEDLKNFTANVDRILRQLESAGEQIETELIYEIIISKLPHDARLLLAQERRKLSRWDSWAIRESLKAIVAIKKMAYDESSNTNGITQNLYFNKSRPGHRSDNTHTTADRPRRIQTSSFAAVPRKVSYNSSPATRPDQMQNRQTVQQNHNSSNRSEVQYRQPPTRIRYSNHSNFSTTTPNKPCAFCNAMHWNSSCTVYITPAQRRRRVQELGACYKCLRTGHTLARCTARPCSRCGGDHNVALCNRAEQPDMRSIQTSRTTVAALTAETNPNEAGMQRNVIAAGVLKSQSHQEIDHVVSVSPCQKITVFNPQDPTQAATLTAFFDSGAHGSYITTKSNNQLSLPVTQKATIFFKGIAGFRGTRHSSEKVQLGITMRNGSSHIIDAYTLPQVTENILHAAITHEELGRLWDDANDELPIPLYNTEPDLIIGSNFHYEANPKAVKHLKCGFHIIDSAVGPMLGGQGFVPARYKTKTDKQVYTMTVCPVAFDIEEFWSLEAIGIDSRKEETEDNEVATSLFTKTIQRRHDGRYSVSWPWKTDTPELANNYSLCIGRLKTVLGKIQKNPKLLQRYSETIQQQLKDGIIEEAPLPSLGRLITYLPHQAVLNENKSSSKFRVVFDASASWPKNKALNNFLFKGPILLPDLAGLLLRLRQAPIVIVSDIEKAFLQVELNEEDRDVTRFLWVKDPSKTVSKENPPYCLRFRRVPFGVISSPFLLQSVIRHHLDRSEVALAKVIKRNTYVDNILLTADTEQEAIATYHKAKSIFSDARMNLRDFITNDSNVMKAIKDCDRHEGSSIKFLGVTWNTESDTMQASTITFLEEHVTRRSILRFIASHFDPLGYISPILLPLKVLLQKLTKEQLGWDEELEKSTKKRALTIFNSWQPLNFNFPRFIGRGKNSIHVFTDASEMAYAATIYIRCEENGIVKTSLLFAKSRLCPIKGLSIQRLELLGILIGVRLINFVIKELNLETAPRYLWSDSQCALSWICNGKDEKLPRFVKNRIREIAETTIQYGYVRSEQNPADIATRGKTAQELKELRQWWEGPVWLCASPEDWPKRIEKIAHATSFDTTDTDVEATLHLGIKSNNGTNSKGPKIAFVDTTTFSTWHPLVTTIAWSLRFLGRISFAKIHWLSKMSKKGPLTASDYRTAEIVLMKQAQSQITEVDKRKWNLMQGCDKVWRCHGRLFEIEATQRQKYPVFLPRKDDITRLLIMKAHTDLFHGGVATTLARIRKTYWIPQGRQEVRTTISRTCMVCKRWSAKPFALPIMPTLPPNRVLKSHPFQHIGTDYLGPFLVKTPAGNSKRWIMLITCMATRAIHLELADDLTAEGCLHCFRRFVARRGQPETVLSDNGSNYNLLSKTLELLRKHTGSTNIQWNKITEKAPWKGGAYERLVGITKEALRRAIGKHLLKESDIRTLLHEVESALNQRPITTVESDTIRVLRPADFLTTNNTDNLDPGTFADEEEFNIEAISSREALLKQWQQSRFCLERFWQIWSTAYFHWLRERTQMLHKGPRSQVRRTPWVGEIVLIREQNHCRSLWKLARVEQMPVGAGNAIRTAVVRVANGRLLTRPISLLHPLEIDLDNSKKKYEKDANFVNSKEKSDPEDHPGSINSVQQIQKGDRRRKTYVGDPNVEDSEEESDSADEYAVSTNAIQQSHKQKKSTVLNVHTGTISKIFFLFLLAISKSTPLSLPTVQLCPFKHTGVYVKLPQPQNCSLILHHNWYYRQVEVFRRELVNIPAAYCSKITRTVCTWAFLRLSLQVMGDTTVATPLTTQNCELMRKNREFDSMKLLPMATPNKWSTQNPVSYSYYMFGTHCTPTVNYILELGSIAFLDGKNNVTDFTRTQGCEPKKNKCFTTHETIIWNYDEFVKNCRYTSMGIHTAHVSEKEVIIDSLQTAFIKKETQPATVAEHCEIKEEKWLMENDIVIRFTKNDSHKRHPARFQANAPRAEQTWTLPRTLLAENVRTFADPENARLQYLHDIEVKRSTRLWCVARNQFIRIVQHMSIGSPSAAVRILLARNDVAARYGGNVLLVTKCQQVEPQEVYEDHQVEDTCYERLPVKIQDTIGFIVPYTNDFDLTSKIISCPWKKPGSAAPLQPEELNSLISTNKSEHIIFNGNKMPDISIDLIEAAIDSMIKEDVPQLRSQTKNPMKYWLTSTEEYLVDIGHDIGKNTEDIEEALAGIARSWQLGFSGIILLLVTAVTVTLYLKFCRKSKNNRTNIVLRMSDLREQDEQGQPQIRACRETNIAPKESVGYTPQKFTRKRQSGNPSTKNL